MAKAPAKAKTTSVEIKPLKTGVAKLRIIGTTPLLQNRMANKVLQGLLVGSKKKTAAERLEIKHHPIQEMQSSAETIPEGPTALGIQAVAIKAAMAQAALETPGLTKASTQRLISVPTGHFALYGDPMLHMGVVRSADVARTPDVRSRCIIPKWCAEVEISFISPNFAARDIVSLLANAGQVCGIGDFRAQKGAGNYGSFRVIGEAQQDSEWDAITSVSNRESQLAALEDPVPYDRDAEELLAFYHEEVERRVS